MSENEWEENDNDNSPKWARELLKKQGQELKELREALAGTMQRERKANVNEALASRGLDPRVAKFYPSDASTEDEAVERWVEENRELFGARVVVNDNGGANESTLTESERRGYEVQKDISAFESAVQMDFASRLKNVEYDKNDEEGSKRRLLEVIRSFDTNAPL